MNDSHPRQYLITVDGIRNRVTEKEAREMVTAALLEYGFIDVQVGKESDPACRE